MSDQELELSVADELSRDPKVDSDAVAVYFCDGTVALSSAAPGIANVDDRLDITAELK